MKTCTFLFTSSVVLLLPGFPQYPAAWLAPTSVLAHWDSRGLGCTQRPESCEHTILTHGSCRHCRTTSHQAAASFRHLPLLLNSWEFFFQYFNQNLSLLSKGWFTQLLSGFIIKYQNLQILSMLTEKLLTSLTYIPSTKLGLWSHHTRI